MLDLPTKLRDMHLHLIQFCLNLSLKRIFLLNRIVLGGPHRLLRFPNNSCHPSPAYLPLQPLTKYGYGEQPYSHDTPQPSDIILHNNLLHPVDMYAPFEV